MSSGVATFAGFKAHVSAVFATDTWTTEPQRGGGIDLRDIWSQWLQPVIDAEADFEAARIRKLREIDTIHAEVERLRVERDRIRDLRGEEEALTAHIKERLRDVDAIRESQFDTYALKALTLQFDKFMHRLDCLSYWLMYAVIIKRYPAAEDSAAESAPESPEAGSALSPHRPTVLFSQDRSSSVEFSRLVEIILELYDRSPDTWFTAVVESAYPGSNVESGDSKTYVAFMEMLKKQHGLGICTDENGLNILARLRRLQNLPQKKLQQEVRELQKRGKFKRPSNAPNLGLIKMIIEQTYPAMGADDIFNAEKHSERCRIALFDKLLQMLRYMNAMKLGIRAKPLYPDLSSRTYWGSTLNIGTGRQRVDYKKEETFTRTNRISRTTQFDTQLALKMRTDNWSMLKNASTGKLGDAYRHVNNPYKKVSPPSASPPEYEFTEGSGAGTMAGQTLIPAQILARCMMEETNLKDRLISHEGFSNVHRFMDTQLTKGPNRCMTKFQYKQSSFTMDLMHCFQPIQTFTTGRMVLKELEEYVKAMHPVGFPKDECHILYQIRRYTIKNGERPKKSTVSYVRDIVPYQDAMGVLEYFENDLQKKRKKFKASPMRPDIIRLEEKVEKMKIDIEKREKRIFYDATPGKFHMDINEEDGKKYWCPFFSIRTVVYCGDEESRWNGWSESVVDHPRFKADNAERCRLKRDEPDNAEIRNIEDRHPMFLFDEPLNYENSTFGSWQLMKAGKAKSSRDMRDLQVPLNQDGMVYGAATPIAVLATARRERKRSRSSMEATAGGVTSSPYTPGPVASGLSGTVQKPLVNTLSISTPISPPMFPAGKKARFSSVKQQLRQQVITQQKRRDALRLTGGTGRKRPVVPNSAPAVSVVRSSLIAVPNALARSAQSPEVAAACNMQLALCLSDSNAPMLVTHRSTDIEFRFEPPHLIQIHQMHNRLMFANYTIADDMEWLWAATNHFSNLYNPYMMTRSIIDLCVGNVEIRYKKDWTGSEIKNLCLIKLVNLSQRLSSDSNAFNEYSKKASAVLSVLLRASSPTTALLGNIKYGSVGAREPPPPSPPASPPLAPDGVPPPPSPPAPSAAAFRLLRMDSEAAKAAAITSIVQQYCFMFNGSCRLLRDGVKFSALEMQFWDYFDDDENKNESMRITNQLVHLAPLYHEYEISGQRYSLKRCLGALEIKTIPGLKEQSEFEEKLRVVQKLKKFIVAIRVQTVHVREAPRGVIQVDDDTVISLVRSIHEFIDRVETYLEQSMLNLEPEPVLNITDHYGFLYKCSDFRHYVEYLSRGLRRVVCMTAKYIARYQSPPAAVIPEQNVIPKLIQSVRSKRNPLERVQLVIMKWKELSFNTERYPRCYNTNEGDMSWLAGRVMTEFKEYQDRLYAATKEKTKNILLISSIGWIDINARLRGMASFLDAPDFLDEDPDMHRKIYTEALKIITRPGQSWTERKEAYENWAESNHIRHHHSVKRIVSKFVDLVEETLERYDLNLFDTLSNEYDHLTGVQRFIEGDANPDSDYALHCIDLAPLMDLDGTILKVPDILTGRINREFDLDAWGIDLESEELVKGRIFRLFEYESFVVRRMDSRSEDARIDIAGQISICEMTWSHYTAGGTLSGPSFSCEDLRNLTVTSTDIADFPVVQVFYVMNHPTMETLFKENEEEMGMFDLSFIERGNPYEWWYYDEAGGIRDCTHLLKRIDDINTYLKGRRYITSDQKFKNLIILNKHNREAAANEFIRFVYDTLRKLCAAEEEEDEDDKQLRIFKIRCFDEMAKFIIQQTVDDAADYTPVVLPLNLPQTALPPEGSPETHTRDTSIAWGPIEDAIHTITEDGYNGNPEEELSVAIDEAIRVASFGSFGSGGSGSSVRRASSDGVLSFKLLRF